VKWLLVRLGCLLCLYGLFPSAVYGTSLTLSDVPSEQSAEELFAVTVRFETSVKLASYYLAGVFYKTKGSNLFGLTQVEVIDGESVTTSLIPQSASPSSFYKITTDSDGVWEGPVTIQADITDEGFDGQGDYYVRIDRFTGTSTSVAESSNVEVIKLLYTPPATPTPTPNPTPTPTPEPTPTPTPTPTPSTNSSTSTPIPTSSTPPYYPKDASIGEVLGIITIDSSDSAEMATKASLIDEELVKAASFSASARQNRVSPLLIFLGSVVISAGILLFSITFF